MQARNAHCLTLALPRPFRDDWRARLGVHLLRLSPESRMNRFLGWTSDDAIERYTATAAPILMVEARLAGVTRGMAELHIRQGPHPVAEIALSVEDDWQRRGIGALLFETALQQARVLGAVEVWAFYFRTNRAMRKITARNDFQFVSDSDPSVVRAFVLSARADQGNVTIGIPDRLYH